MCFLWQWNQSPPPPSLSASLSFLLCYRKCHNKTLMSTELLVLLLDDYPQFAVYRIDKCLYNIYICIHIIYADIMTHQTYNQHLTFKKLLKLSQHLTLCPYHPKQLIVDVSWNIVIPYPCIESTHFKLLYRHNFTLWRIWQHILIL